MVTAGCAPGIRCSSDTPNVNAGGFAAQSIRRMVFLLNHGCLAGSCFTDMETPTTKDSDTMVSAQGLETTSAQCLLTPGCGAGCAVLCCWAATGPGHHCSPDGVGLSKHYILCFYYTQKKILLLQSE